MTVALGRAAILDGRRFLDEVVADLAARRLDATMGTVVVGADGPGRAAIRAKHRAAARAGIGVVAVDLPASASQVEVEDAVRSSVGDGVFVQLPLPEHLDTTRVVDLLPPQRDIDGLRPDSHFVPATADAVLRLLERGGIVVAGRQVVIVGDSPHLAVPLAGLVGATRVEAADADLVEICRRADVIVSAADVAGLITTEHVRPGAAVVDAGVSRTAAGVVGDVGTDVESVAGAIVPMPGGVGPATIACLLEHTARAAGVGH